MDRNNLKWNINHWYLKLISGLLFFVIGFMIFYKPDVSYMSIVILFSYGFIINGVIECIFASSNRIEGWGWTLTMGIIDILIGIYLAVHPFATAAVLPYMFGFILLLKAGMGWAQAIEDRHIEGSSKTALVILSLLTFVLGVLILYQPAVGSMTLVYTLGCAMFVIGFYQLSLAFNLKKLKS
ncbi:DUF308 domain-containing protein [Halosquirtibacter xylanolyticus]|uniref:HdeD family acid-resistance protein n=1 Tax=Halosquirtibacter xylanolyticus TaxID=3374599 RepID=UPI0037482924|nr:DUF308 domain-containing protein [Prolixibacteraceae bacterium]